MQKSVMHGGKKYNPNKMTDEQKDELKETNPKLYSFMFDERVKKSIKTNKKK